MAKLGIMMPGRLMFYHMSRDFDLTVTRRAMTGYEDLMSVKW